MQQLLPLEPTLSTSGWDHAALAIIPHSVTDTQDSTRRVERQVVVDGKVRRIVTELAVSAGDRLPNHADAACLLAVLQMAVEHGEQASLTFHQADVLKRLGLSSGGLNFERVRRALQRYQSLVIRVSSAVLSRDGREYNLRERAVHVIDEYSIEEQSGRCKVVWGTLISEGLLLHDIKRLDWNLLLRLDNPLTMQLYRLLDRVTLNGDTTWSIGWRPLADLLGMEASAYARPARFRQVLEPHLARLVHERVLTDWQYSRGGEFVFELTNYLRAQLRGVLIKLGVYPQLAAQLVAGFDELRIMRQCDQCAFRSSESPAGYLVRAIQQDYDLKYPEDEPQTFRALLELFLSAEVERAVRFAGKLTGRQPDGEPEQWPTELRAVTRVLLTHGIDPDRC
jgi:hypothetical protein